VWDVETNTNMVLFLAPIPLYSTLQVLSGYTFGAWDGAVLSYFAALFGAFCVFVLSRSHFRAPINRCLSHTASLKRVVRAIEKRPKLLFLIRLAPYPYNVMNALLAGSPTLTLRTYMTCTALSLFKVIIHTSIGASIHSFAEFHVDDQLSDADGENPGTGEGKEEEGSLLSQTSTFIGIGLCIAIAIYLSYVARRAVDEELEHETAALGQDGQELEDNDEEDADERATFLRRSIASETGTAAAAGAGSGPREMVERTAWNGAPPPSAGLHSQLPFLDRQRGGQTGGATAAMHTVSVSGGGGEDKFELASREEASIGLYSYY
jgi:uncharacterized membrane protein YdjX (TVP38/TMEM64 family)